MSRAARAEVTDREAAEHQEEGDRCRHEPVSGVIHYSLVSRIIPLASATSPTRTMAVTRAVLTPVSENVASRGAKTTIKTPTSLAVSPSTLSRRCQFVIASVEAIAVPGRSTVPIDRYEESVQKLPLIPSGVIA